MSEPSDANPREQARAGGARLDGEALDALPVRPQRGHLIGPPRFGAAGLGAGRPTPPMLPAVQVAAVAAGGFVAGAAFVGLAQRRRRARSPARRRPFGRGARGSRRATGVGELVQIVGSRSLLVDVHLLGGLGGDG